MTETIIQRSKPKNTLIGYDGYSKIADLWVSKENTKGDNDAHSFCWTPEYLPPETSNPLF